MRLRMLLNTGFSGPQAWLLLAITRGYVARAGIELELTPGTGAYNAAAGMVRGGFDLGYGDINALVEVAAADPATAPTGVFATFRASAACIAVPRGSAIRTPADLAGAVLIGHASDVALRTFGAFCATTGLARDSVLVEPAEGPMASLADRVLAGEAEGLFCYGSTLAAALAAQKRDSHAEFVTFRYADLVPDLYGSAVMASPRMLKEHRDPLMALLRAFQSGLVHAFVEREAAIEAVMEFAGPEAREYVERRRWYETLAVEMRDPERGYGLGWVERARFKRGIALHAQALGLPMPDPIATFTNALAPGGLPRL